MNRRRTESEAAADSVESFIDELSCWRNENNLPDDVDTSTLLQRTDLTAEQRAKLEDFDRRWDALVG